MPFLLRKTADGPNGLKTDLVAILSDQGTACYDAREWVGAAHESEGSSRATRESMTGETFRIWRTTDHGQRRATVQRLEVDDTDKGLA